MMILLHRILLALMHGILCLGLDRQKCLIYGKVQQLAVSSDQNIRLLLYMELICLQAIKIMKNV